jgi:CRP/FNR family transcriptional regulator, nitrogen oxide reductase regulator
MPCSTDRDLLGSSDLFRGVEPSALDEWRASAAVRPFCAGATLFQQGDDPTHLHLLASGEVKLVHLTAEGGQLALGYHQPGATLGCVAVMGSMPHPVTAISVEAGVTLAWTAAQVEVLLGRHPLVLRNAARLFSRQIEELLQRVRELTTERVEQRVARAVRRLIGPAERTAAPCLDRPLPLSRQDLAELTGATLFTVSRIMSAWEQQGIVASGRQRVLVLNADRLAHLAEGR